MIMMPMTIDGASGVEHADVDDVLQVRRDPGQGEVAEDHGRDAGQQLEDRLEHLAQALAGVLGEEDRRGEADRQPDEAGEERDLEGVRDERQDAVAGVAEAGAPLGAREEVDRRDLGEELDRALDEGDDDAEGREDGDAWRREERADDDALPRPLPGPPPDCRGPRGQRRVSWHSRGHPTDRGRSLPTTPVRLTNRRRSRRSRSPRCTSPPAPARTRPPRPGTRRSRGSSSRTPRPRAGRPTPWRRR